eukprot:g31447.t1
MTQSFLQPDIISYNSMVKASRNTLDAAENWMYEISRRLLQPNEVSFGSMLDACARTGQMGRADLHPGQHCYTSLVKGAAQNGDFCAAEKWMLKMEAEGYVDEMSYGSMLKACSSTASVKTAERWFQRMLANRVPANTVIMSSLLDTYAEACDSAGAARCFEKCVQSPVRN